MENVLAWLHAHPVAEQFAGVGLLLIVATLAHLVTKRILLTLVARFVKGTAFTWDDALEARGVFRMGAWLAPALVFSNGARLLPFHPTLQTSIERIASAIVAISITLAFTRALSALNDVYNANPRWRSRPIKGYVQLGQMFVYVMGAVAFISVLFDKSPWAFLSGVGAMTAVLLLVFKDTILSLVASVQLASNDMVRVGDWIEMPQYSADGDVIDVALHTVKVQNWDKTVSTIPTYALISEGFRNWRTMPQSGGRRIKRSVYIDIATIKHLDEDEIHQLHDYDLLTAYMDKKMAEVSETNRLRGEKISILANKRRLTNIGTFRAYIDAYLRNHPGIHQELTLMVRHLPQTPDGLPLEIYCFANDTRWVQYEGIQADIFDHIMAIAPEFDLRVFQNPSGADIRSIGSQVRDRLTA